MIKVDLHVHTSASDGISSLDEMIRQAKSIGLDAIAICDHNLCTPLPDCDFPLIPATEISTTAGHVLGLFVTDIDYDALRKNGLPTARAAIAEIHRKGGLAVLAHPFEIPGTTEDTISGLDFDFIEGANSRAVLKVKDANAKASDFAAREGKPIIGGSDAHSVKELGGSYTLVDCDTPAGIESAIRAGKMKTVFSRQCSWAAKGYTRLLHAFRRGSLKQKMIAILYFGYAILRNLLESWSK